MKLVKIITPPKGFEVDKEKSTFEKIVFKSIYSTYVDICRKLFRHSKTYYINMFGQIKQIKNADESTFYDANNAPNEKQLNQLLALNKLMNIAYYYNKLHDSDDNGDLHGITYHVKSSMYCTCTLGLDANYGVMVLFKRAADAQAVIDNPNFRTILDAVYK